MLQYILCTVYVYILPYTPRRNIQYNSIQSRIGWKKTKWFLSTYAASFWPMALATFITTVCLATSCELMPVEATVVHRSEKLFLLRSMLWFVRGALASLSAADPAVNPPRASQSRNWLTPDLPSTLFPFHSHCAFIVPAVQAPVGGVVNHLVTVSPVGCPAGLCWCLRSCSVPFTVFSFRHGVFTSHYLVSLSAADLKNTEGRSVIMVFMFL